MPENARPIFGGEAALALERAVAGLRVALDALDTQALAGSDARRLLHVFIQGERLCQAGAALAARRVEQQRAWQPERYRSPAHFLAAASGVPVGQAVALLETARRLERLPSTSRAFRAGQLSSVQVREVASAAGERPDAERALLATARTNTVAALRERCRNVRATVAGHEDRYDRLRRRRYFRHWTDAEGAVRLDASLPPDDGARLLAAVDARRGPIFAQARRAGRHEPYDAYAADALVALADGGGAPRATVHVRVDRDALMRGHVQDGETCDIPGVGPIPVAVARRLGSDAVLKVIVTKGVDVVAVAHGGRTIPAHLRTALEARDPTCVVPGWDTRDRLEIDHVVGWADGGLTELSNLARLCGWHHMLKSHHGYGLEGRSGEWVWKPPDDPPP